MQEEKATDPRIGKHVEFHASRIFKGNPIKGVVTSISDEWIEVELAHTCEGMVNIWPAGSLKEFRISLISGTIKGI